MSKPIYIFFLLGLMAIVPTACKKSTPQGKKALARVYDNYLYKSDLAGLVGDGVSTEDSALLVSDYIDTWIRHQLLLRIAEENLPDKLADIDKQAGEYRESLLIYAFEQGWQEAKLDTVVSETELVDYLDNNTQRFLLKENVYQMDYVIVGEEAGKMDSLKTWFGSTDRFRAEIDNYCLSQCIDYFIESDRWFSVADLKASFPGIQIEESQLQGKRAIEIVGDQIVCLFRVTDKRIKGRPGPFSYFREEVTRIILNSRKRDLMKQTYQDVYLDGKKKDNFEIYSK